MLPPLQLETVLRCPEISMDGDNVIETMKHGLYIASQLPVFLRDKKVGQPSKAERISFSRFLEAQVALATGKTQADAVKILGIDTSTFARWGYDQLGTVRHSAYQLVLRGNDYKPYHFVAREVLALRMAHEVLQRYDDEYSSLLYVLALHYGFVMKSAEECRLKLKILELEYGMHIKSALS